MKNRFYYLLVALIITQGCKETLEDKALSTEDITILEQQYNDSGDINSANELLSKYAEYSSTNPQDKENSSRYLRRAAQIYNVKKEYLTAASTTVLALKQFYHTNSTEANIADLVNYYKRLDNQDAAETTMNGYIMAFPNGSKVQDFSNTLGDKKQSLPDRLNEIANQVVITADGKPGLNNDAVNKFVGVSEIYALTNNTLDTLASDYLFKAGKLAMTIGNLDKALECYAWLYTSLNSAKEAPSALFTHAFALDNQLGRKEEAKGLYEQFLNTYPNHHFADDARFQLKNLGKNDAQIIEEFNKKANSK